MTLKTAKTIAVAYGRADLPPLREQPEFTVTARPDQQEVLARAAVDLAARMHVGENPHGWSWSVKVEPNGDGIRATIRNPPGGDGIVQGRHQGAWCIVDVYPADGVTFAYPVTHYDTPQEALGKSWQP